MFNKRALRALYLDKVQFEDLCQLDQDPKHCNLFCKGKRIRPVLNQGIDLHQS